MISVTPSAKQKQAVAQSSSEEISSDDESNETSPSKFVAANTSLSELSPKARELLDIIATCKQIVKYVKLVRDLVDGVVPFSNDFLFKSGFNKPIQDAGGIALKQATVVRWLSLSNLLESIESSIDHVRSMLSKSTNNKQCFKLNRINIDGLRDLIGLLSVFKDVSLLVQTGARPSLHMAYIAINKLERHLNGTDVDKEGQTIGIDDLHEGDRQNFINQFNQFFFILGTEFFRKRLFQLLRTMFAFDEKHMASAVLHPLYRRLTFANVHLKGMAHSYIRQQINEILCSSDHQDTVVIEPSTKKHKSMEDQFADPDDVNIVNGVDVDPNFVLKNDELERYHRLNIEDEYKQSNPLPFWRDHHQKFPCLSLIARRLFSIPVTSAAVERSFSAAGVVVTERRSSLDPSTVNDILFVRSVENILQKRPNFFS